VLSLLIRKFRAFSLSLSCIDDAVEIPALVSIGTVASSFSAPASLFSVKVNTIRLRVFLDRLLIFDFLLLFMIVDDVFFNLLPSFA
jgi:hypothetical protein